MLPTLPISPVRGIYPVSNRTRDPPTPPLVCVCVLLPLKKLIVGQAPRLYNLPSKIPCSTSSSINPVLPYLSHRQTYVSFVPSDLTRSKFFTPSLWFKTHPTLPRSTSMLCVRCQDSEQEALYPLTTTTPPPLPILHTSTLTTLIVQFPQVTRHTLFFFAPSYHPTLILTSPPSILEQIPS